MVFATEFDPTDRAVRVRTSPTASTPSIAAGNRNYQQTVVATAQGRNSSVALNNDLRASLADDWGDDYSHAPSHAGNTEAPHEIAFGNDELGNVVPLNPTQPSLKVGSPALRVRIDDSKSLHLPKHPKLPFRLQLLNRLQQGSTVVTTFLVAGALLMYGSTVYVDKSTHRALLQLDSLQGESQQLTSANESIKQSLAEQAVKEDSGLEPYEAGDVLFLAPEPLREGAAPVEPMAEMPGPLGY